MFAETSYVQWVGVFVLQINICPLEEQMFSFTCGQSTWVGMSLMFQVKGWETSVALTAKAIPTPSSHLFHSVVMLSWHLRYTLLGLASQMQLKLKFLPDSTCLPRMPAALSPGSWLEIQNPRLHLLDLSLYFNKTSHDSYPHGGLRRADPGHCDLWLL